MVSMPDGGAEVSGFESSHAISFIFGLILLRKVSTPLSPSKLHRAEPLPFFYEHEFDIK